MASPWTLTVEKLGKIQNAKVDVSPLTLFVGQNNTGKSYLATLLWGVRQYPPWFAKEARSLESYKRCVEWVEQHYPKTIRLSPDDENVFASWIRDSTRIFAPILVQSLFNQSGFMVGDLSLIPSQNSPPLTVKWNKQNARTADDLYSLIEVKNSGERELSLFLDLSLGKDNSTVLRDMISLIASEIMTRDIQTRISKSSYFLPASRTGYMLLYSTMADYSFERTFGDPDVATQRRTPPRLPRSAIEFVKLISNGFRDKLGPFAAEADELEKELRGSLELRSGVGINQYYYHSEDGHEITMPLSSSMVTELAPIILLLRHAPYISTLVLEEPEVHLHPIVQRKLAVVIARLIRKGVTVVITTHGDLFCHQINNLIKLGAHPRRAEMQKKLGYAETDYLLPDEVSGYDFRHVEQHTEVVPLQMTEFGLVMPTFNDELKSLVEESRALEAEPEVSL